MGSLGLEPRTYSLTYHYSFRYYVVWTLPSPYSIKNLGAARQVSTPSRLNDRLGSALPRFAAGGSPTLSSSTSAVSH